MPKPSKPSSSTASVQSQKPAIPPSATPLAAAPPALKAVAPVPADKKPESTPAVAAKTDASVAGPTHEQIARRAFEIYLARGGRHGSHADDWFQAERELRLGKQ